MPVEWTSEEASQEWEDHNDTQTEYRASMMLKKHHEPGIHKRVCMTKYAPASPTGRNAPAASGQQPIYDHRLRPKNQP